MELFGKNFYFWGMSKSYRTLAVTAVLGFGLGLSACSDDKVAGGGPSGTEAGNAITAQILTADKTPAARAKVKLVESASLEGSKDAYTAETDKNGQVVVEGVASGSYILEASLEGKAIQTKVKVSDAGVDLGTVNLADMATINGFLGYIDEGTIKVRGLDHSAKVVNGEFVLDSLPAGHFDLVYIPNEKAKDTTSTYLKIDAGKESSTSTFANERQALLLDDFEDGNNQHRFGPKYFGPSDGGWWFQSHHSNVIIDAGTKIVVAKGDTSEYLKMYDDGEQRLLHVTFNFDTLRDTNTDDKGALLVYPWANVGVGIGSNDKSICYDLSSVDSISFKVRGTGSYYFIIEDETHKKPTDGNGSITVENKSYGFKELSDEWETVTVATADIVDETKGSLSCVTILTWQFTNTVDFWMDDVKLIGGDRQSIWEK